MEEALEWKTIKERQLEIANRFVTARKALKISRDKLSIMSNIPVPTIRRFESTGEISLHALVSLMVALNYKDDLDYLFKDIVYKDIKDMIYRG